MPRDGAHGSPCVHAKEIQTSFEDDLECPPRYYCFWDAKPFNVTDDGTKVDIPEADYPVDPEGKYESAYDQPFGYCDCNKFYAFTEPGDECSGVSAGTYFFNIWAHILVVQVLALFFIVNYSIYGFIASKQFKNNASCQTLCMASVTCLVILLFQGGYCFTMNGWDYDFVFHNQLLSLLFSVAFTCWGVTMLNIAIAWIEVVERSQKKGQKGNTVLYKRVIYGAMFLLSVGVFVCNFILGSPQMAGGVVFLSLIFMAVVFYFGGKKLGDMLRSGAPKGDKGGEMTMETMVDETSKKAGKGALLTLILVMLFIMFTNNIVWLSTLGIQGGMQVLTTILVQIIMFIRFGGRRAMNKLPHLKPVFACEQAKQGKLDQRRSSASSVAPESSVEAN
ncbi:hypothetical protein TrLO_g4145 [Triparma laevis f. longispina]|uniref:Uncharacterized protein n=1 Tax=Triparma laevis f. longispina TaxID=1714387 RepID=A0A9W7KX75_9STRA|nr:hypothetical protein TrLO_g4145 [Triparma laevis f. longispina]